jgi:hypothetical protein
MSVSGTKRTTSVAAPSGHMEARIRPSGVSSTTPGGLRVSSATVAGTTLTCISWSLVFWGAPTSKTNRRLVLLGRWRTAAVFKEHRSVGAGFGLRNPFLRLVAIVRRALLGH